MAKCFLEVFPTLKIAEPLKELLGLVQVEKVTTTRDRSSIRIYLKSPRLIHKQNIYDLEKGIKDQLFPDKQVAIKIQEKYRLSDQYTPKKLLDMYKESLLLELKNYSIIEYTMFRKAQINFDKEDLMVLSVEDTMVNRDRTGELKRVIEKVFTERCGLPVEVGFTFVPPQGNDRRRQIELKMEREAQAIYWQNHKEELAAMGGSFQRKAWRDRSWSREPEDREMQAMASWIQAQACLKARPGTCSWPRPRQATWEAMEIQDREMQQALTGPHQRALPRRPA